MRLTWFAGGMDLLVLGGTAWLGGQVARAAVARGHAVTVLARGRAGSPPPGVSFVAADRSSAQAYPPGRFDAVVDVARDPQLVATAQEALAGRVGHWVFVSSCSVYADQSSPGDDEQAALLPPSADAYTDEQYGEAKVRCERLVIDGMGADHCLIARSGLITGPGDATDRTGYWPLRLAHPGGDDGAVLVPDVPEQPVQWVDVRDQADWLVAAAEGGLTGIFDVAGAAIRFADYLAAVREVVGHRGAIVPADPVWLAARDVEPWAGPRSLPIWLPEDFAGMLGRRCERVAAAGFTQRPLAETIADTLAWEVATGPGRARRAGLSAHDERELLAANPPS